MTTPRQELDRLLAASRFEIMPLKSAVSRAQYLPHGATVSVTASPAKGMEATLSLAEELQEIGLDAIPHLAARMIENRVSLEDLLARMGNADIGKAFVVGGDSVDHGEFTDAARLLDAMADVGHDITHIGIAGYPEGHPLISNQVLRSAMAAKEPHAAYVVTQMCFDVPSIVTWIRKIRAAGIELPVYIGMPGVVDPVRLVSIGARIGVGASMRYIMKNRSFLGKLLRPGPYRPTKLAHAVARASAVEDLGIAGFHIFTFNEIERTVEWRRSELDQTEGRL